MLFEICCLHSLSVGVRALITDGYLLDAVLHGLIHHILCISISHAKTKSQAVLYIPHLDKCEA